MVDIIDVVSFGQREVVRLHMPLTTSQELYDWIKMHRFIFIWNRIRFLDIPTQGQITTRRSPWQTPTVAQAEI
jgi:hypothetical protein